MICARCADAADQQLGRDKHCAGKPGPGTPCDCQHRTDRYQRTPSVARPGRR
ncbi:hypothetical protein ACF06P_35665 [Streptomyces sp. NPDC015684]|uniref:hypothetical protein n=1 Tax=Streptomyces sp. NPDC015684 TaxID=3364963 RepID=UPI00370247D1